jgi:hypothetical protein
MSDEPAAKRLKGNEVDAEEEGLDVDAAQVEPKVYAYIQCLSSVVWGPYDFAE